MKWLNQHTADVGTALFHRLCQEPNRRWQRMYHESEPGTRGGIAVVPADAVAAFKEYNWRPVQGVFADASYSLTRLQIIRRLTDASRHLPILEPEEPWDND